jgi:site-specific recombinase XerD
MFETLFDSADALARHRDGPFAEDRERFLERRGREGFSHGKLRQYARLLLWIAGELDASPGRNMTVEQISSAADRWWRFKCHCGLRHRHGFHPRTAFIKLAESWFQFLGRFSEAPKASDPFAGLLRDFTAWMEDERGLAALTVTSRLLSARRFLKWYGALGRPFTAVHLTDIDAYLNACAQRGWSRCTIATETGVLRAFFQHAGRRGWCPAAIAGGIKGPRLYCQENLPQGPSWENVERLLSSLNTDDPCDIRDLPMLMLCAIYGLRPIEVARLRLEDLDWENDQILVRRRKVNKAQVYPLTPQVGNAILRYLKEVRPRSVHREVFLTRVAPVRPVTTHVLTRAVSHRMLAMGIRSPKHGAYALRHACATHLASYGVSFKVIGDHLGHSSPDSTRVYAKVDLPMLRQVAMLDLGGVQ